MADKNFDEWCEDCSDELGNEPSDREFKVLVLQALCRIATALEALAPIE